MPRAGGGGGGGGGGGPLDVGSLLSGRLPWFLLTLRCFPSCCQMGITTYRLAGHKNLSEGYSVLALIYFFPAMSGFLVTLVMEGWTLVEPVSWFSVLKY